MERNNKTSLIAPLERPLPKTIGIGRFQIVLPEVFGFCGGVVHAIKLLEETYSSNPGKRIFLLGEIIHNKNVNDYFLASGVNIIPYGKLEKVFTLASPEDILVIPAFGIVKEFEDRIRQKFPTVIDTTCKDVKKVWDFISAESIKGSTILIHGYPFHPEVEASISRASDKSDVILIPDRKSAENFIKGELKSSSYALANQTTMLYSETCAIEEYLRAELKKKGLSITACQTICKATYMRQIAADKLLMDNKIDMVFVVGGYDSSNTNNLYKLAKSKNQKAFYIKDSSSVNLDFTVEHYLPLEKKVLKTNLVPFSSNIRKIGILAGASCPVSIVEGVIEKLAEISNLLKP